MAQVKRILIMAGGTGGHVFPGLVMARYFKERGVEVHWLGTEQGLEAKVVPDAGFPIHYISIGGLRGKDLKTRLMAPWRMLVALMQSLRIIHQLKPDVVIGMGGFVSGPGGLASWLLRRPLVLHEQNAKIGLTNKILSHLSIMNLEGFPHAFPESKKVAMVGNPVRDELTKLPPPDQRQTNVPYRLLVIGGSGGALALNQAVPKALTKLDPSERPTVLHQTGGKTIEETKQLYQQCGVQADITPFITEMDRAYGWADVVLCRAGASTIAELCVVGLGAILVPYPYAVDDHQTVNAGFMVQGGAAILVPQTELTEDYLAQLLRQLAREPQKRLAMAQAAWQLRRDNVAGKIYQMIKEI